MPSGGSRSWSAWRTPTWACAPSASRLARAIDLFVQIARFSDGTRRITYSPIVGMEGDLVTMQDIFVFEKTGLTEEGKVTGTFRATGIRPKFYERLAPCGIKFPASVFQTVVEIGGPPMA